MKIYQYEHVRKLAQFDRYLVDVLQWHQIRHYGRGKEPSWFFEWTPELHERITRLNTMAALKGMKVVKPVYRDYYHDSKYDIWYNNG
jgi:hypothetical protein